MTKKDKYDNCASTMTKRVSKMTKMTKNDEDKYDKHDNFASNMTKWKSKITSTKDEYKKEVTFVVNEDIRKMVAVTQRKRERERK